MAAPQQCPECGASLPSDALDGLCPTCGFRSALKADPQSPAPFHPSSLFDPPSAGGSLSKAAVGDSPSLGGDGAGEGECSWGSDNTHTPSGQPLFSDGRGQSEGSHRVIENPK